MGTNSKIEWTHHTFNCWVGCSKVSPACAHCYAESWAKRTGQVKWGDAAERRRTSQAYWKQPLKWNAEARAAGERRRVFCASLADVFDDHVSIQPGWRADLGRLILETSHLNWLLLTKRPENIKRLIPDFWIDFGFSSVIPKNVWLGVTCENQEQADKRIPLLLEVPARVRFLSCEPLLSAINLNPYLNTKFMDSGCYATHDKIDWVIAGGESGPGARPSYPDWFQQLRDQCVAAKVPFHFKQHGEYVHWEDIGHYDYDNQAWHHPDWFNLQMPGKWVEPDGKVVEQESGSGDAMFVYRVGKKRAGRILDGRTWDEFPEVK